MPENKAPIHFLQFTRPSLLYDYFAYIDSPKHMADDIFARHKVVVKFRGEWKKPGAKYQIVMCKVRKADTPKFLEAMEELPQRMLICGYPDYLEFCEEFNKELDSVLSADNNP